MVMLDMRIISTLSHATAKEFAVPAVPRRFCGQGVLGELAVEQGSRGTPVPVPFSEQALDVWAQDAALVFDCVRQDAAGHVEILEVRNLHMIQGYKATQSRMPTPWLRIVHRYPQLCIHSLDERRRLPTRGTMSCYSLHTLQLKLQSLFNTGSHFSQARLPRAAEYALPVRAALRSRTWVLRATASAQAPAQHAAGH